jgi:lysozyme
MGHDEQHRPAQLGAAQSSTANDLVIDISHWNEGLDFAELKRAGIVGVIHKATEDTGYVDPTYAPRRVEAEQAGLLWGAYHFLRPGSMQAQAEHFVSAVGNADGVLLAADHEDSGVSLEDLRLFLGTVWSLTAQRAVVYSGHVIKGQLGDDTDTYLAEHRLWLAHYSSTPTWPTATWPS